MSPMSIPGVPRIGSTVREYFKAGNHHRGRSHFGGSPTKADDAEERRRQMFGQPSLKSSRDLEGRKQYVRLYIEYAAEYGPDGLYLEAIAYLKELEAETVVPSDGFYVPLESRDAPRSGMFPLRK